ncbi:BCCT family transporter [Sphingopyxis sp. MWB1]|uniref:BCCT family transporter n=1 Tax=Sphingopyxis sp. MWB1 TaxID=1537715 RepID=UPI00051A52D9|nr:BCCT family transporter [Sphingopyxis sp. MWB1]
MPSPNAHSVNRPVFFIPLAILVISIGFSLWRNSLFLQVETDINDWILLHFGRLFALAGFAFLPLLAVIAISPFGGTVIGGAQATPLLGRWRWFAVTLCTTVATGILFWGVAEPLFHLNAPPPLLGLTPGSEGAAAFAMSTMFLHWTFTPYAIYTVAALAFALLYYNQREPFRISSLFVPLIGRRAHGVVGSGIDIVCLFALVAGMSASLGAGVLALAGGIEGLFVFRGGEWLRATIAGALVLIFILSAVFGLRRGIARLSLLNIWLFFAILLFVLFSGVASALPSLGLAGAKNYIVTFIPRSFGTDVNLNWHRQWTIFNWANWFAWAPITALFLGRLAVGYSVRSFILFNLLFPALFGALWMTIIAGTTITLDQSLHGTLYDTLVRAGPDPLLYSLFSQLGGGGFVLAMLILAIFLSYVTAADSNVSAMSALSTHGITPESPEAPLHVKLAWGVVVGLVAVVLVAASGLDGIRMMSVLGGFPALFVVLGAGASLALMAFRPHSLPRLRG